MKRFAFTLAEVLITLAIIGVVAALTLPTLIHNYQKKVLEVQFKKSYSNLQNVINSVNTENGEPFDCYFLKGGGFHYSQCTQFYEEFFKKLQVVKICNFKQTNCFGQYKTREQVLAEGGKSLSQACSYPMSGSTAYNLNDGSMLYVLETTDGGFNNQNAVFIGIDVNGKKGPNRWGYDLFYLNLLKKDQTASVIPLTYMCELIEKGGRSAEEILQK